MNKAVKYRYQIFTKVMFGQAVLVLIDREPDFYKKYKSIYDEKGKLPDPKPLVKYLIRKYGLYGHGDEKKMLNELKEPTDPYGTIRFWRFDGRFRYDDDKKGFVPFYTKNEGSRIMKAMYDKAESTRVKRVWEQAQKYIVDPNGDNPELIYDEEPA